jgi:pimeloyl-ACP methyl ester carboxylesterase
VVAIELQAHGHTPDIDRPLSFEQDADDVAALLKELRIEKADLMGFSNGGTTCLQIAIRYPDLVNKLVLASTTFKRDGMQPGFWEGMKYAILKNMPQQLRDAYLKANPDPKGLQAMFDRDVARMLAFKRMSATRIYKLSRHRRWSLTVTPKWCVRSMRWHCHARCRMLNWPSCRADMGDT